MTSPNGCPAPCDGGNGLRAIYVASSWRNRIHPTVIGSLRAHGHRVYDFKHPDSTDRSGFRWTDLGLTHSNPIDGDPRATDLADASDYVAALNHPAAVRGFQRDFAAMLAADTFVLVLPCGRSAHLELGWAVGARKRTAILLDDPGTPELMYLLVDMLTTSLDDLLRWLAAPGDEVNRAFDGYTPEHLLEQLLRHDPR